jgi:hypothetical protein
VGGLHPGSVASGASIVRLFTTTATTATTIRVTCHLPPAADKVKASGGAVCPCIWCRLAKKQRSPVRLAQSRHGTKDGEDGWACSATHISAGSPLALPSATQ